MQVREMTNSDTDKGRKMMDLDLQQRIYEIISDIPAGKVATYGQIAWMAGRPNGHRIVARIVSSVPAGTKLPCYRVVNKAGKLAPVWAFGGESIQRQLLEKEGVIFRENGCIDMKRCLWQLYVADEEPEYCERE